MPTINSVHYPMNDFMYLVSGVERKKTLILTIREGAIDKTLIDTILVVIGHMLGVHAHVRNGNTLMFSNGAILFLMDNNDFNECETAYALTTVSLQSLAAMVYSLAKGFTSLAEGTYRNTEVTEAKDKQ